MTIIKKRITAFFAVVIILCTAISASAAEYSLGGVPFGVKIYFDGAVVSGIEDVECEGGRMSPGRSCGIRIGDIIESVNGEHVQSASAVAVAVADSGGEAIELTVKRQGATLTLTLVPEKSLADGRYHAGLLLKDSSAGIGTVTYMNPETGEFAGLGHGICDSVTGALLPLYRGVVLDVNIVGIKRGAVGAPGEIRASFSGEKSGTLLKNTELGVYGVLTDVNSSELISTASRDEVREGEATLYCTLDSSGRREWRVRISNVDRSATGNKCFTVEVCDKALIEKTGGIVQGMSGSPIVQNGKLVGALTHVFVDDPTRGYGIFIENMEVG